MQSHSFVLKSFILGLKFCLCDHRDWLKDKMAFEHSGVWITLVLHLIHFKNVARDILDLSILSKGETEKHKKSAISWKALSPFEGVVTALTKKLQVSFEGISSFYRRNRGESVFQTFPQQRFCKKHLGPAPANSLLSCSLCSRFYLPSTL